MGTLSLASSLSTLYYFKIQVLFQAFYQSFGSLWYS
jgi:hypothetical protein